MSGIETPEQPKELHEGRILTADELTYRRGVSGEIETKANNLWMNLQTPSENTEPLVASYLYGGKLAEKITNQEDKVRFIELSQQLSTVAPWSLKGDARWDAVTSSVANAIYYEMYTIARRNGISNSDLIR